ncbi:hypothetical protein P7C73_g6224, partial [Tremellales sp. Uapishka_1]
MTVANKTHLAPFRNTPAPGGPKYIPKQPQVPGSLLPASKYPQNAHPPAIFAPITIRGTEFANRMWIAPMCQYSADNGHATDWHLVHLGSMVTRGWSTIMVEASAVVPEGRITPEDMGIWQDSQIAPLKRIVEFVHQHGGKIGIQLAHAGRKASTLAPWVERIAKEDGWEGGSTATEEVGGWPNGVYAPSPINFHPGEYPDPIEIDDAYIQSLKKAYLDAVERSRQAGFDYIEVHGAHGYLFHNFVSPLSNHRTDNYGGSLENRLRLPLEIVQSIRAVWDKPLFYRVSASDWLDGIGPEKAFPGEKEEYKWWGIEQTTILTQKLADLGVDLIDVSSGGNDLKGDIKLGPGYQVGFAEHLKKNVKNIIVGAVGLITDANQSNEIVEKEQADVCLFAREQLRDIDFPLRTAQELGAVVSPSVQYERAWSRMLVPRAHTQAKRGPEGKLEVEGEEGNRD